MTGGPAFQAFCVGGRGIRVKFRFALLSVTGVCAGVEGGGGGNVV